ncbi:MAG: DUF2249 domain-containing protein [Thermaerobacter sp.]|nr:DUF2249 domain-containing protein [Thermaerobacter sp.]
MSQDREPAIIINAPVLPPAVRHQTIFAAFKALPTGFSALLVNDHDPKPLLYQMAAENPGEFSVAYQETGSERFVIRVTRD